ncbi:hypothetical protein Q5P01_008236 [Channa striata]|uniref:Uncharacterized protein n=1 Tax=Channa striata TaxID=64152 RepID=A0AA88N5M1_CHASR|nr:hypothetical protein Q5P01_008236 [Channa striata]
MNKTSISTDQELRKGEYLMSENGNYKAVFQGDGNFVVYAWSPIWATNTHGKNPYKILLQQDGNLVMYPKHARHSHFRARGPSQCERHRGEVEVAVCLHVVSAECCDAPGGQMAVPAVPVLVMEDFQFTDHGHGGLLFLPLDQVHEPPDCPQPGGPVELS